MLHKLAPFLLVAVTPVIGVAHADTYIVDGAGVPPGPGSIVYPNDSTDFGPAIATGVDNLNAKLQSTSGPTTIIGVSEGAIVVDDWLREHGNDPSAPKDVKFIVAAPPTRSGGLVYTFVPNGMKDPMFNQTVAPPADTPYNVDVVKHEYDGWADFPDRPLNLVADANAVMGMSGVAGYDAHTTTPLDPNVYTNGQVLSQNTNDKGGTTTTYLVHSDKLPLTDPLRTMGVPSNIVDGIDKVVRPIVDAGYSRNDPAPVHKPLQKLRTTLSSLVKKK